MTEWLATLVGIFQQADYDPILFRTWLRRHPGPDEWGRFSSSAKPAWSLKARTLFCSAFLLSVGIPRLMPRALELTRLVFLPLERAVIEVVAFCARRKLARTRFQDVIGVTGSFGKTTAKDVIAHVLAAKFRVHKTPENTNTLLGVAGWILSKSDFHSGDVLIVEMGAYRRGDIVALCRMVRPTLGVLTGLNEAHLERFGSLENTFWTKAELIQALPSGALLVWNASSPILNDFLEKNRTRWPGIRFAPFIGDAADAAAAVAKHTGLSDAHIAERLRTFKPMNRRFAKTLAPGNRLIIDDSYNITLDGARRAVEELKKIPRRRIGVFAGIPEAGNATERVNKELGELIAGAFEIVLLRKTPYEGFIRAGLENAGFAADNIIPYTETAEVQQILARIACDGDCVYFSAYDLPAIYL